MGSRKICGGLAEIIAAKFPPRKTLSAQNRWTLPGEARRKLRRGKEASWWSWPQG